MDNNKEAIEYEEKFRTFILNTRKIYLPVAIVIIVGFYFVHHYFGISGLGSNADFGAFGDYLGGLLNPILGFLTVLLLVYSISFQLQELKRMNNQITETKEIHKDAVVLEQNLFTQRSYLEEIDFLNSKVNRAINDQRISYSIENNVNGYALSELPFGFEAVPEIDKGFVKQIELATKEIINLTRCFDWVMQDERQKAMDASYYEMRLKIISSELFSGKDRFYTWLNTLIAQLSVTLISKQADYTLSLTQESVANADELQNQNEEFKMLLSSLKKYCEILKTSSKPSAYNWQSEELYFV
ncbi:hypothetical protein [Thalassotalea sp. PLHSN55]|uniref:hypothetical protein n=1 Tax=Thalassotalea sp. PLHSN55 TaxID=3435888 RepID=UPI003F843C7E